jgi:hypothetical protein
MASVFWNGNKNEMKWNEMKVKKLGFEQYRSSCTEKYQEKLSEWNSGRHT